MAVLKLLGGLTPESGVREGGVRERRSERGEEWERVSERGGSEREEKWERGGVGEGEWEGGVRERQREGGHLLCISQLLPSDPHIALPPRV
jgi:hypothetical protein